MIIDAHVHVWATRLPHLRIKQMLGLDDAYLHRAATILRLPARTLATTTAPAL